MKKKFLSFMPGMVFLLFTFSFCILFFALPKSEFSEKEKRYLAEAPDFSIESLLSGQLVKEIDGDSASGTVGYVADHFPMRSFFVGLNAYGNLSIGNTASSDYYYGKDGYIITKPYQTNRLDTNLEVINSFSENINVTLAVVPSAGSVLQDKLPLNSIASKDGEVYARIKEKLSENVNYCDLEQAMKEMYAKGDSPYYKTDHHWVTAAAYEGYCRLGEALSYTPTDEKEYTKKEYDGFYGTTYSSSGYFLNKPDTLQIWEKEQAWDGITVEIHEGEKVEEYSSMFFESHLSEPDMYPVFLDGNHPLVKIKNSGVDGGKLLIIKDSYAHALTPFLTDHYREIVMVDMRYYKESITELCEKEGICDALVLYSISNFCTDTGLSFLE